MTIYLTLDDEERLDVASTVAALQAMFPGTTVTADDSFEAERQRKSNSIAEIAATGKPLRNPMKIIQNITNKERVMGPGVDVSVPIGASSLFNGHVWAKDIKLSSDASLLTDAVELLKTFLASLGVGRVQIVDDAGLRLTYFRTNP